MSKPLALITNDDGIDSWFLRVLVEAMQNDFEVVVAAPMGEQSWIGRAMSRRREVHIAENETLGCTAYALDGTPSDCVNIALGHLMGERKPDVVCSGINLGYNACLPLILSSGTVAGAMEGAFWGLPAVAFSHVIPQVDFEAIREKHGRAEGEMADSVRCAAALSTKIALSLVGQKPASPTVHNINFPRRTFADSEVVRTIPSPMPMHSLFAKAGDSSFRFNKVEREPAPDGQLDDMEALNAGKVSHTVLDLASIAAPVPV
ncbi:5'/3'-nucleotidase SurE [Ruficoccus amylovorans]|uniref:5'-nucleotidase n=1 Tax=Ruficoccus amylovorans TaxID=1804625 RepID=A0A842HGU8_9BACT|nr:5'/3'-nucleotidase SurE [Ruficoccus amylovorans]MBC2594846.1 5'/3'-nucleotidase SurE [Ruficoccus amylovorans]